MLMFYAGVGCLVGIALGVAGMPPHRAFYLGMAWPAFFYALARRLVRGEFLHEVERWAGIPGRVPGGVAQHVVTVRVTMD